MAKRLIILTNCSERKRQGQDALRLAEIEAPLPEKARRWCKRLSSFQDRTMPAVDRYQGDHWSASLAVVRKAEQAGWDAELWVASAGYGLIPDRAPIRAYAATFAPGHPDGVAKGTSGTPREAAKEWWSRLGKWPGPCPGAPRTLEALAAQNPDASWLIMMSPTYLDALSEDLLAARAMMNQPAGLLLVSGHPGPSDHRFSSHWIPTYEKCRRELGGSCTSLNARLGGHLVRTYAPDQWSCEDIREKMIFWMNLLDFLEKPDRTPMSDQEALSFIRKRLRSDAFLSHTALLKELRASGRACEQKRFRSLFQAVQGGL